MKIKSHIPNALTCANLLCGGAGIAALMNDSPMAYAAYFVWAGCLFDFLDGNAARLLKVSSPLGRELDSLADVVTFGALPSLCMYKMLEADSEGMSWLPYLALSLLVFSAIRLAVFNLDESQQTDFKGLPTPANALFITSLCFLPEWVPVYNHTILAGITILFSYFLVSPVRLMSLKFKNFSWKDNKAKFTFLVLSVLLLCVLRQGALPWIIIMYLGAPLLNFKQRV
ncbi:MAG: CDP-diacylglycerol--serine O-phosphatidyltransferase [Candidatus Nephrothrix sp. EaCA]|nr:MAG: CDP-diacylglycerol--serine O-phosphatidyltransferase [Candidatus Nephrothrix sp. EaCA]